MCFFFSAESFPMRFAVPASRLRPANAAAADGINSGWQAGAGDRVSCSRPRCRKLSAAERLVLFER